MPIMPAACQLILSDSKGEYAVSSCSIMRLEAADNYTIIYFKGRQPPFTVSKVLKVYEELLRPYGFVRTHRSHLINQEYVQRVERHSVVMQDAFVAPITQRKKTPDIQKLREEKRMVG